MEGARHMDTWVAGINLGHTYPHSQMNKYIGSKWMNLLSRWNSVLRSTKAWI
jgi:hypothetical protein